MIITIRVSDDDGVVTIEDDFETRTPWDDPERPLSPAEAMVVKMVDRAVNELGAVPKH